MEILCAYVRKNCGPPPPEMSAEERAAYGARSRNDEQHRQIAERETALRAPYVDVQAVLTVIGRRGADRRALEEDLRATSANPDAYRLDFTGAALMKARLEGLHFEAASFDGACLECARGERAHLESVVLDGAYLEGAALIGAHLEGAQLDGAHIEGARLGRAHLEGAWLNWAHLEGAWLHAAHLEGAQLYAAYLEGAWLDGAHLEGALLNEAQLAGACLKDALLDDALFNGADLSAAIWLSLSRLSSAWGDAATALPPDMDRPANHRWLAEWMSAPKTRDVHFEAWGARRDFWLGEARKRREAEAAARGNPLPG